VSGHQAKKTFENIKKEMLSQRKSLTRKKKGESKPVKEEHLIVFV